MEGCLTLLVTRDGGQTWVQTPCDELTSPLDGEAGFAASNGNICIEGDTAWVFTGVVHHGASRSTDRGHSWAVNSLPIRQGSAMTGVFSASFANAQSGLAMGGDWESPHDNKGNLISTTDGGFTWDVIAEGTGPGYRSCIRHHPIRQNEVVSVGKLGIDVSTDGGHHWTHVSDSSQYVARFSPDGRSLWMAGNMSRGAIGTGWPMPRPTPMTTTDQSPKHLKALAQEVSRVSGLDVTCTRDCEVLSEELHAFDSRFAVSTSTLRRFLGWFRNKGSTRQTR